MTSIRLKLCCELVCLFGGGDDEHSLFTFFFFQKVN